MSMFEVKVRRIDNIEVHPNADKLELAVVGGYRAVVKKGEFVPGQLALYIPTDSVVPDDVAHGLGVKSYLVGKYKNRVKAVRLRGQVSQGIVLPGMIVDQYVQQKFADMPHAHGIIMYDKDGMWNEGHDWTEFLGITKYEEPIPIEMAGHVRPWPSYLDHFDVENVNHPDCINIFQQDELVMASEKLHGTNMAISIGPGLDEGEQVFICSRRMALKDAEYNLYWIAARKYGLIDVVKRMYNHVLESNRPGEEAARNQEVTLRGEVVGIQDLKYGFTKESPGFFAFDIRINGEYLNAADFRMWCEMYNIPMAPKVYFGSYDYNKLKELSSGPSIVHPETIREGIVVRPARERHNDTIGRVMLKFISEDYLTRSEGTELH